jgi:heterotetrameric sarcosine oxidase gamma subunit
MLERASPLAECPAARGLSHRPRALLLQYHAWPECYVQMARMLAHHAGVSNAPSPGKAAAHTGAALLRVHPQRLWLISDQDRSACPTLDPDAGATLDLSHARVTIHAANEVAIPVLSRFIAIDLRPDRFAIDDVVITPLHRVSVVLWRRADGIDILAPRSFARSIWELLAETIERLI